MAISVVKTALYVNVAVTKLLLLSVIILYLPVIALILPATSLLFFCFCFFIILSFYLISQCNCIAAHSVCSEYPPFLNESKKKKKIKTHF